eukprot:m.113273 g.113273  ORF g.113273 m.113273 type:complete len:190 (-) comp15355_c0_seq7:233-802(-)
MLMLLLVVLFLPIHTPLASVLFDCIAGNFNMRAVIQRIKKGTIKVGDEVVCEAGPGIFVQVGIAGDDTQLDMDYIAKRVLSLRLFGDEHGIWKKSAQELDLDILCVSQFSLYANCEHAEPKFDKSMPGASFKEFYEQFLFMLRANYCVGKVKSEIFGTEMEVETVSDGPFTVFLDSNVREPVGKTGRRV